MIKRGAVKVGLQHKLTSPLEGEVIPKGSEGGKPITPTPMLRIDLVAKNAFSIFALGHTTRPLKGEGEKSEME